MISLRPYQQTGVDAIRASYRAGKRAPLYVLPCGGGKSIVLSYIALSTASRSRRVTIQCHRVELIRQLSASLDKVGCPHGIIASGYSETLGDAVQLASVDTLARRVRANPARYRADLIITDEAHHLVRGNKWGKIVEQYPQARLLGVTASPARLSGQGLGAHAQGYFDDLIIGPPVRSLVAVGALVPTRVFAPPLADLSGVRKVHGDYDAKQSSALLDKATVTGDAIAHYKRICNGQRAIVFGTTVEHSRHVSAQFAAAGIPSRHVDADTPPAERESAIQDFQAGRVLVLCNQGLFTEGLDCPGVVAVIMLRRTASLALYIQMAGRASRPAPGKECGYLIDHVGNVAAHGMPDFDGIQWTLDGRAGGKKAADDENFKPFKCCPACYAMVPSHRPTCDQCGERFEADARVPQQRDGELVEVTGADLEFLNKQSAAEQAKRELRAARTEDELKKIAQERGYAPGWVRYVMAARQRRGARA